jgi:hypothetical protein
MLDCYTLEFPDWCLKIDHLMRKVWFQDLFARRGYRRATGLVSVPASISPSYQASRRPEGPAEMGFLANAITPPVRRYYERFFNPGCR